MVVDNTDITIRIANNDEIKEFQRLLFRIYCEELKWHPLNAFPDGIFTDEYDDEATFLTVYKNDRLISGVRVVRDTKNGFPHEKISFISLPHLKNPAVDLKIKSLLADAGRSKILEVTRFIGEPTVRRIHMYDLLKALYWFGITHNIEFYFMVIDLTTFLLARKLGFEIQPIGTSFLCEGSWCMPAIIVVKEISPGKIEARDYFFNKNNLIGNWS